MANAMRSDEVQRVVMELNSRRAFVVDVWEFADNKSWENVRRNASSLSQVWLFEFNCVESFV